MVTDEEDSNLFGVSFRTEPEITGSHHLSRKDFPGPFLTLACPVQRLAAMLNRSSRLLIISSIGPSEPLEAKTPFSLGIFIPESISDVEKPSNTS